MKLKIFGLAALSTLALMAIGATTASATTLEVGGVTKNSVVEMTDSLKAGQSVTLSNTSTTLSNTCTESHLHSKTESPFTGTTVAGSFTSMTFKKCHSEPVTVHKPGSFYVEWEKETKGKYFSKGFEGTVSVTLGESTVTVNCKTGEGTLIGTLNGVASGEATLEVNAVLNCGFLLPSAEWRGTYRITSPAGLGISQ